MLLPSLALSSLGADIDARRTAIESSMKSERCLNADVVDFRLHDLEVGVEVLSDGILDVGDMLW